MAGDEFRIAGAYVEVHLRDETSADEKIIRARIEGEKPVTFDTALKDPANTKLVKEKIERETKPVLRPEVTNPIDDAWRRKVQAAIRATSDQALNIPVTADTADFRRDLDASIKKAQAALRAEIPTEPEDAARYRAQLLAMIAKAQAGIKTQIPVEVDDDSLRTSARRGGAAVDSEMSRVAKRANASFDGLKFLGLSIGLPAAATIGAAGVAGAVALVAGGFGALGVAMVANNERVLTSFQQTSQGIQADARAMAQPLEGDVVAAIDQVGESWNAIRPAVQSAVRGSAPAIRELTGAATDLAKNAMPGVVDAVLSSEEPLKGLRSWSAQAGTGLGQFLTNASKGGKEAGGAMRDLGGITQDVLAQSGTLLAHLAGGANQILPQFGGALNQVFTIANNLASNGMPLLTGTTSGFLGTVGGGLNIVTGMTAALGSWAAPLGQAGGSLLATNAIAKLFGTSLGETGFGVRAFATTLDESGNKTNAFKQAMDGVDGKGNKLKAGLKSVVEGGFNPLGLALLAGGFLLDQWGQKTQEAAAKAAEYNAAVADIKGTLSSTGAVTANTRAMEANNLSTKKLGVSQKTGSELLTEYGIAGQLATDAMTGNLGALDKFNTKLDTNVRSVLAAKLSQDDWNVLQQNGITTADAYGLALGGSTKDFKDLSQAIDQTSGSADENLIRLNGVLGMISGYTQGQRDLAGEVREQARATAEAQRQMRELGSSTGFTGEQLRLSAADSAVMSAALATLGDSTKSVTDQGGALGVVLDQLSGKNVTLSAAQAQSTKSFDDADKYMKQLKDSSGKLRGTFDELVNGEGGINGLTAKGASLQGVFASLSTAMGTEVSAAFAQSQATGDDLATSLGRVGEVTERTRKKFIDAATAAGLTGTQAGELADRLGLIPDEVAVQFAAKGDQQLQDKLLTLMTQIRALPTGKSITLSANEKPAVDALAALGQKVVQMPNGTFQVFADTKEGQAAAEKLIADVNASNGMATVHANTGSATGSVYQWQQRTNGTWGMTTTDTRVDPATGKVQAWMMQANGTWGWTNLNTRTDPANGQLQTWVQRANGTWAWVNANANTAAAEAALNYAARDRTAYIRTITVGTPGGGGGGSLNGPRVPNAQGNILKFFAGGGFENLSPMSSVAQVVPPNTWRVVGDNMQFPESYIPLDPRSTRSQRLLDETNERMGRTPAPDGGTTTTVNNYTTVHTAAVEPYAVAAAVSAELGWTMRGG